MSVKVKLLGTLPSVYAGRYPPSGIRVDLPPGACVADLVETVGIPRARVGMVTINGTLVRAADRVPEGADVKLFQKIAGG